MSEQIEQAARALLDELRNIVELHNGNSDEMLACASAALTAARRDGAEQAIREFTCGNTRAEKEEQTP